MIALLQRVSQGKVLIENILHSEIKHGYVLFLGIHKDDNNTDIDKLINKIIHLRIMGDKDDKMNKSILETKGEILVVSQFTLYADVKKGRRPSFIDAMEPEKAEKMYELFIKKLKDAGINVQSGVFGAMMEVQIFNDGPVTIIIDSKRI